MNKKTIKECPKCNLNITLDDLLYNENIEPIEMSICEDDHSLNLMYFNHNIKNCFTTFAVYVEIFKPLLNEPIPPEIKTGTEGCNGHCSDLNDTSICNNNCTWSPYRRFMNQLIEKKSATSLKL